MAHMVVTLGLPSLNSYVVSPLPPLVHTLLQRTVIEAISGPTPSPSGPVVAMSTHCARGTPRHTGAIVSGTGGLTGMGAGAVPPPAPAQPLPLDSRRPSMKTTVTSASPSWIVQTGAVHCTTTWATLPGASPVMSNAPLQARSGTA